MLAIVKRPPIMAQQPVKKWENGFDFSRYLTLFRKYKNQLDIKLFYLN